MKIDEINNIITKYNINLSILKRNYLINPLEKGKGSPKPLKGEIPFKEDLVYLYLSKNMKREDILKFFNCGATTFKRWCRKLNISKPIVLLEQNAKKSIKEKYNVSNYSQTQEYRNTLLRNRKIYNERIYKGMLKSGNFGKTISKEENYIYKKIKQIFPFVKHQYKNVLYPWKCDFYIPEIDTYIEYQGFWKHGPVNFWFNKKKYNCHCAFDKNNKIHQEIIKFWKSKKSNFYDSAIKIWTISDPLKRKTAKDNHLNFKEFFTLEDFEKWFLKNGGNQ